MFWDCFSHIEKYLNPLYFNILGLFLPYRKVFKPFILYFNILGVFLPKKKMKKNKLLQIKMKDEDLEILKQISDKYNQSYSSFARYILLKQLKEDTRKE